MRAVLFAILCALFLSAPASAADSILLDNGETIEGNILSWNAHEFLIFDGKMVERVPVRDIRQINFKPMLSRA